MNSLREREIVFSLMWRLLFQLEELRSLKLELEDQSLLVFEENEERLRTIQEQEAVSS